MPCLHQIPHLNALHKRMFDRGLVVVGVTGGTADEIEAFVKKHEMAYPVAIGAESGYDHKGIPACVLVDPLGKVAWKGHPSELDDKLLEKTLEGARAANIAAGLEEVGALSRESKFGDAYLKAKELLAGGKLSDEAKAQAERRIADAESTVTLSLEQAATAAGNGDIYGAWAVLEPIQKGYAGVPRADEAAQKVTAMLADKKQKREIDAGQALAPFTAMQKRREYDAAYAGFKKLANQWSGTKAALAANAAALAIQKGGKLNFDRGCGACLAADKTCSLHAKKKK